jgi:hypothetical protein
MISTIFIIPYRNRDPQKHFFEYYMKYLLEDVDPSTYEIVFAHQKNDLPFNRGAVKNIGFLYAKEKYEHYKDIVFVFNDIDTLPYKKGLLDYSLRQEEVKHYYGFTYCLGGMVAIRGQDFERINGFPSFWNWGWEDTILYERVLKHHLHINRDQFYEYGDSSILHLIDGVSKSVSMRTYDMYKSGSVTDGLNTLRNVNYVKNDLLDIETFECSYSPIDDTLKELVLKTQSPIPNPNPKQVKIPQKRFSLHYR